MRKLVFLVIASFIAGISVSCANVTVNKQHKKIEAAVLERDKKLESAINSMDLFTIWEMSSPGFKEDNPKYDYFRHLLFLLLDFNYRSSGSILVVQGNKYAITQNHASITYSNGDIKETHTFCQRTIWLKYPDNWYWDSAGWTCDYLPNNEYIMWLTNGLR